MDRRRSSPAGMGHLDARAGAMAPQPERVPSRRGHVHWQAWTLRALLAALIVGQLVAGNPGGAIVAAMGLAVALIPVLITRWSGWHVPRPLELTFVGAMFLQYASESLKLFEILTYWDKIVHPAEIFLATGVATFLLLGYRECHRLDIPDGLAALGAMLFGMTLGATWELIEFALDWFGNANLQKSNADTLTDILTNNGGAIFGALFAFWLFRHRTTEGQRERCGEIADWLTDRLARLLERHGVAVGIAVALAFGIVIFLGWQVDRGPLPAPPPVPGEAAIWDLASGAVVTAALRGDWQAGEPGICRATSESPRPGSEQMGLLQVAPDRRFGDAGRFTLATHYALDRPPLGAGTAMAAGLAFGIRDPNHFYLLQANATHDVVALERYVHGRKRVIREERVRTRGGDRHALAVAVDGERAVAWLDGHPLFEVAGMPATTGGIGIWARVTTRACFSDLEVTLG